MNCNILFAPCLEIRDQRSVAFFPSQVERKVDNQRSIDFHSSKWNKTEKRDYSSWRASMSIKPRAHSNSKMLWAPCLATFWSRCSFSRGRGSMTPRSCWAGVIRITSGIFAQNRPCAVSCVGTLLTCSDELQSFMKVY